MKGGREGGVCEVKGGREVVVEATWEVVGGGGREDVWVEVKGRGGWKGRQGGE